MSMFEKARTFIYRNARPIDLARWKYHFENGSKEDVLIALSYYQNKDGGFGHAIEPDLWNEKSSPLSTSCASSILREIDFYDNSNEIVKGILEFYENTKFQRKDGWSLKIPSNNDYPHAPWWEYSKETEIGFDGTSQYNPTAGIVSFIVKSADKTTELYKKAISIASQAANKVVHGDDMEMHEAGGLAEMFLDFPLLEITMKSDQLLEKLKILVSNCIEKDITKWCGYIAKPSQFFNSQDNIFYADNKEIAEYECDFILKNQLPDGSWNINWRWSDYPEQWEVAKNWWKGNGILANMLYLKGMKKNIAPPLRKMSIPPVAA